MIFHTAVALSEKHEVRREANDRTILPHDVQLVETELERTEHPLRESQGHEAASFHPKGKGRVGKLAKKVKNTTINEEGIFNWRIPGTK